MEDTLWDKDKLYDLNDKTVLILILMEDTLWVYFGFFDDEEEALS